MPQDLTHYQYDRISYEKKQGRQAYYVKGKLVVKQGYTYSRNTFLERYKMGPPTLSQLEVWPMQPRQIGLGQKHNPTLETAKEEGT